MQVVGRIDSDAIPGRISWETREGRETQFEGHSRGNREGFVGDSRGIRGDSRPFWGDSRFFRLWGCAGAIGFYTFYSVVLQPPFPFIIFEGGTAAAVSNCLS